MAEEGLELTPKNPVYLNSGEQGEAKCEAVSERQLFDADLQAVINRWHDLPNAVKAGILAVVCSGAEPLIR